MKKKKKREERILLFHFTHIYHYHHCNRFARETVITISFWHSNKHLVGMIAHDSANRIPNKHNLLNYIIIPINHLITKFNT